MLGFVLAYMLLGLPLSLVLLALGASTEIVNLTGALTYGCWVGVPLVMWLRSREA